MMVVMVEKIVGMIVYDVDVICKDFLILVWEVYGKFLVYLDNGVFV